MYSTVTSGHSIIYREDGIILGGKLYKKIDMKNIVVESGVVKFLYMGTNITIPCSKEEEPLIRKELTPINLSDIFKTESEKPLKKGHQRDLKEKTTKKKDTKANHDNSLLYEKSWFIILALIVFWPIGLIFLWKSKWKKFIKLTITILIALVMGFGIYTVSNYQPDTTDDVIETYRESTDAQDKEALSVTEKYLKSGDISKPISQAQLTAELVSAYGYPEESAEYVCSNIDLDWNEMCIKQAKLYMEVYDKEKTKDMLLNGCGYTEEQVNAAIENIDE